MARAWDAAVKQATAAQAASAQAGAAPVALSSEEGSWLTRKVVGPVPGWGVVAGVTVLAGGALAWQKWR